MSKATVKTREEIEVIAEGGKILHEILYAAAELVKPGISTWALNKFAEDAIYSRGGRPSFKGYGAKKNPFPAGLCTSINSQVVHGIPSVDVLLKPGDIISLDIGMEYQGLYTDTAITVGVGTISPLAQKLMDTTQNALAAAIAEVRDGAFIGDLGYIMQKIAEDAGFNVVRDLVGHGVGYDVHEEPAIPCFGKRGQGEKLKTGMVIAIEPMLTAGEFYLIQEDDGWTLSTRDESLAAHFEHTVAITKNGARILT